MNDQAPPYIEVDEPWQPYLHSASPILFDARQARRTASLFVEVSQDQNRDPIFTMKDYDVKGCISMYNVFMNSVDEGDAAMKLVGCLGHWRKLLRCSWFMNGDVEQGFEGLIMWRQDMLARDMTRSKAIYEDRMRAGDLSAARAMMTLIEKMDKMYKTMSTPSPQPAPKGSGRRGSQQKPQGEVVDLSKELDRLSGNK